MSTMPGKAEPFSSTLCVLKVSTPAWLAGTHDRDRESLIANSTSSTVLRAITAATLTNKITYALTITQSPTSSHSPASQDPRATTNDLRSVSQGHDLAPLLLLFLETRLRLLRFLSHTRSLLRRLALDLLFGFRFQDFLDLILPDHRHAMAHQRMSASTASPSSLRQRVADSLE